MVDTRFSVSVHIMTSLAYVQPELMSSETLALGIRTNPSFIRKLVVSLSAAGLVESVRGKAGGIRLAKKTKRHHAGSNLQSGERYNFNGCTE